MSRDEMLDLALFIIAFAAFLASGVNLTYQTYREAQAYASEVYEDKNTSQYNWYGGEQYGNYTDTVTYTDIALMIQMNDFNKLGPNSETKYIYIYIDGIEFAISKEQYRDSDSRLVYIQNMNAYRNQIMYYNGTQVEKKYLLDAKEADKGIYKFCSVIGFSIEDANGNVEEYYTEKYDNIPEESKPYICGLFSNIGEAQAKGFMAYN